MIKIKEFIRVELTILSNEKGGRKYPLSEWANEGRYMPHIVIGNPNQRKVILTERNGCANFINEEMLAVCFWKGPKLKIHPVDEAFKAILGLIYAPSSIYDKAIEGVTFTLREGGLIAGFGTILNRWKE